LSELLTEQEQIQQLKTWLKQYGPTVIAGIVIAFVLSTGWQYWQNYRNRTLYHASAVYDEMLTHRAQGNTEATDTQAKKLMSHYSKTPYAQMAALMLARDAVASQKYADAVTQLNWVINHSNENSIRQIARLRIARILIADKKPQDALTILKSIDDKSFLGLIDEIRGDAYTAMNQLQSAKDAYQLAEKELPNADVARPILQMKLDNA
jgi:predicted negative regulator of RcsB-dependent stress response